MSFAPPAASASHSIARPVELAGQVFEGTVTFLHQNGTFGCINNDCYFNCNVLMTPGVLQVGDRVRVTAIPHQSGRNKWRALQVESLSKVLQNRTLTDTLSFQCKMDLLLPLMQDSHGIMQTN